VLDPTAMLSDAHWLFIQCLAAALVWLLFHRRSVSSRSSKTMDDEPQPPSRVVPVATPQCAPVVPPPLSNTERARLCDGELIFRPYRNDAGINRGVAVQKVKAPPSVVWAAVMDFDRYPEMVDDVCATEVYEREGATTKVAVSVGVSVVRLTTCLHHVHAPAHQQLTWSLDSDKPSQFKSNDGFWLVHADPADGASCVVYYSIAVELKAWVPSWVNAFVAKQGLPRAVAWLKREAERRAALVDREHVRPTAASETRAIAEVAPAPAGPHAAPPPNLCVRLAACFGGGAP